MRATRLLLVDDHQMYLDALAGVLGETHLVVVGTAVSAAEALHLAGLYRPDLALVDSVLDRQDGIKLAARLRQRHPDLKVMVMAEPGDLDIASAVRAVRAGASAFLPKATPAAELARLARGVMGGETHIPPLILTGVLAALARGAVAPEEAEERLAVLSAREREVLELMAAARDTAGIAEELFLSPHTVRTHVKHILTKLEVHSSLEAVSLLLVGDRAPSARIQAEGR